jgi:NAD(P)-dependent dehydrogenase (short-subunit alcohol dehydrogenase family)
VEYTAAKVALGAPFESLSVEAETGATVASVAMGFEVDWEDTWSDILVASPQGVHPLPWQAILSGRPSRSEGFETMRV